MADEEALAKLEVDYIVYGRRFVPSAIAPRLQGYIYFKALVGKPDVLGDGALFSRTTTNSAVKRIKSIKTGQYVERGMMPAQLMRTDLDRFMEDVKSGITDRTRLRCIYPALFARHFEFVDEYINDHKQKISVPDMVLSPWQKTLFVELKSQANDRTVVFLVDKAGTTISFAQYICCSLMNDAQFIQSADYETMAFELDITTRVLFVNVPREATTCLHYDFLQSCKDRLVFCTKHTPYLKHMLEPVHVVVLMADDPNMEALSFDRYDIRYVLE